MKTLKSIVYIAVLLAIIGWGIFLYRDSNKTTRLENQIEEIQYDIDSVRKYYEAEIDKYKERTDILDSLIRLSNENYEEDIDNYWDSVSDNTPDTVTNSELSDFLEDLANGRR